MSHIPIPEVPAPRRLREEPLLQRVMPLLTLVIAVVAIALAAWEGCENRRYNRLTVRPRLGGEIEAGRVNDSQYVRLAVESTGLGPAVIRTFRIYLDGQPQDTTVTASGTAWSNVIAAVSDSTMRINAHGFGEGYYFPPGRRYVLFEANRAAASGAANDLARIPDRVAVQVCYCSVYSSDCDEVVLTTARLETLDCTD